MTFPALNAQPDGTFAVDGIAEMTPTLIVDILTGNDADALTVDSPGWVRDLIDAQACTLCGSPIVHVDQHLRWHYAIGGLATLVTATDGQGSLSDDDQREADYCATGDAG